MAQQTNAWKHLRRVTLDNGMVVLAKLDRETGEEMADSYENEAEANEMCQNLHTAGVACHVGSRGPVRYVVLDDAARAQGNDEALSAFLAKMAGIDDALGVIQQAADDHFGASPEKVHWGHVGDLGWVLEQLEEVREFADPTQKTTKRS
jgi:hypothetical protein